MGLIAETIKKKLTQSFNPSQLSVIDESHKHAHHAGAKAHKDALGLNEGESDRTLETHFHVVITSDHFKDMSLIARHRAVMDVLADELAGEVHALRLDANATTAV